MSAHWVQEWMSQNAPRLISQAMGRTGIVSEMCSIIERDHNAVINPETLQRAFDAVVAKKRM